MLKAKYALYTIITPSKGFSVERRYSDFAALRQELGKEFAGYVIPPLPGKKITGNVDPAFVQERKGGLQLFLNDALRHPLLWDCGLVTDFLSLSSKDWELKTKLLGKMVIPKEIENYVTIEGEAKVLFNEKAKDYSYRLLASTKDIKDCFTELKKVNKTMAADFEKLSTSMARAGYLYHRLNEIFRSLNVKGYDELLQRMHEGHSRASEVYKSVRNDVLEQFGDFFRFYANEVAAYDELLMRKKNVGEQMDSLERKLAKRKEQKFEVKNTATWELDSSALVNSEHLLTDKVLAFKEILPKESQEARKLRMLYGCLLYTSDAADE
eukprot:TRINITY_DN8254_c0_g3_i1.p1 TRINITY_DN8254_c0_g3~~TRINITY_DN8254_c0_g3_i1.p1  ORF type:complete len:324 (+),score=133.21 TRINITY_DN8254_c0_g3_i1:666-1637(+)